MLVFNEGLPRSGKSYDAVKNHILPALKAGRRVYARINGLNFEAIGRYLKIEEADLRLLLIEVTSLQVKTLFVAQQDMASGDHGWRIAPELKDSLFVVDEAHEFYVASRESINPAVEQFFALCGQNGMDGVLMSQWYRRLHSSVRARIERKNVFQKLTAAGLQGKYNLKMFHATEPDRFELVDTAVQSYDPLIFPLYQGYAEGSTNKDVYTAGGRTVWHRVRKLGFVAVPVALIGFFVFYHFLHNGAGMVKAAPPQRPMAHVSAVPDAVSGGGEASSSGLRHAHYDEKGMSAEVQYVFDLCSQLRPRLAGVAQMGEGQTFGVVEWGSDQGRVQERMTFEQLRALGVTVEVHPYGVKLAWKGQGVVVTPWPLDTAPSASSSSPDAVASGATAHDARKTAAAESAVSNSAPHGGVGAQEYDPPTYEKRDLSLIPGGGG